MEIIDIRTDVPKLPWVYFIYIRGWNFYKDSFPTENYNNFKCFFRDDLETVAGVASANPDLSTLVTAVEAAGLVDTLNGEGPLTVFAPNNDAFAKIPEDTLADLLKPENVDQLKEILLRHVLPTSTVADDRWNL